MTINCVATQINPPLTKLLSFIFDFLSNSMIVDEKLVDHLAHLSRLKFNPEEKEAIRKDMEKIIGFVEKLNELEKKDVENQLLSFTT